MKQHEIIYRFFKLKGKKQVCFCVSTQFLMQQECRTSQSNLNCIFAYDLIYNDVPLQVVVIPRGAVMLRYG